MSRRRILFAVGAAGLLLLALAPTARADMSGPCAATVGGLDVDGRSADKADDAIPARSDGAIAWSVHAPTAIQSWEVSLEFGPFSRLLDHGSSTASENTQTGVAPVSKYAYLGVGLYVVDAAITLASGEACHARVLVLVEGNPLSSIAGFWALAAIIVGALGAAGVGVTSYRAGFGSAGRS